VGAELLVVVLLTAPGTAGVAAPLPAAAELSGSR
jgi:hypothetical protein